MKQGIIYTLITLALIVGAFLFGRYEGRRYPKFEPQPVRDTIYRTVPMRLPGAPQIAERTLARIPLLCFVHDTTVEAMPVDTAAIILEYVQSIQQDTAGRYTAFVSGYKYDGVGPRLDSLHLNIPERIITETIRVPVPEVRRWGIGIQAGYGIALQDPLKASPYIGIGVSYNILSW